MTHLVPISTGWRKAVRCRQSRWSRWRARLAIFLLTMQFNPVHAIDLEILRDDIARRESVLPDCDALKKSAPHVAPMQIYRTALCLLYGAGAQGGAGVQSEQALALLRNVADRNLIEAQMALGDTLQKGDKLAQKEALRWYGRAGVGGHPDAIARLDRLARRMQGEAGMPDLDDPANGVVYPSRQEMRTLHSDGYHCHMMGIGRKWCHSGLD